MDLLEAGGGGWAVYGERGGPAKQTATKVPFLRLLAPPQAHLVAPFGGRMLQEGVRGLELG